MQPSDGKLNQAGCLKSSTSVVQALTGHADEAL
jgi:hypothetical protein